jgi:predicted dehydrogenase
MHKIESRLAKIERATKHLRAQAPLKADEFEEFLKWCDADSLQAILKLDNQEAGEFLSRCSDEILELFVLYGEKALTCSDDELLQSADEQTRQSILKNSEEIAKWRGFYANHKPITLAEWLRSEDQEMLRLARHFNEQLADFRALKKVRF